MVAAPRLPWRSRQPRHQFRARLIDVRRREWLRANFTGPLRANGFCQKMQPAVLFALREQPRPTPAGMGYFCRTCGTQAVQVKIKALAKKKEKQLVAYSEGTILMRTVGFGTGGTVVCGGIWAGFTAMTGFDMPAMWFAPLTGVGCGYAVKIASQDRARGLFLDRGRGGDNISCGGRHVRGDPDHGAFSIPVTINSLAMGIFGLLLGLFVAQRSWRRGFLGGKYACVADDAFQDYIFYTYRFADFPLVFCP